MAVALVSHLVNNGDIESKLLAKLLENRRIALAATAKMKIVAGDDMGGFYLINHILPDEILRLQHGKRLVKIQAQDK